MPESRRFRLSAVVAGMAVIAAALVPAFPAAAEDLPTPDPTTPVVAPVETTPPADPTPEQTAPAADPTPTESTPAADPTPTTTPTEEPVVQDPEPTPAAGTVTYSGTVQELSGDDMNIADGIVLFQVDGQGYLRVDVSGLVQRPDALTPVALTLSVPAGLTLSGNANTRFQQLAAASATAALVPVNASKIKTTSPKETSALVNQTPNVAAHHKVFAVYVSPSNKKVRDNPGQALNSTTAQTLVDYADSYWNSQSDGSIRFDLQGVVQWYQSTYSCATDAGSTSLWNQAMVKAKAAGFIPGKNNHLVLIMPNGGSAYSYCGGAIGLGTVGGSVNQGGLVWVMGSTDPIAKETIAHELGHNMSLGHADWLSCPSSSNPPVGANQANYSTGAISGCTVEHYGDVNDVMGFGMGDGIAGALSSPQAIRAGIWPSSRWTTAPIGSNQTFTLRPVSDHNVANVGWRSVVVQDTDGTAYFVELRNQSGDDSSNTEGCQPSFGYCTIGQPNVRVLRFEPTGFSGYPGEDTYAIGRNSTSVGFTASTLGTLTLAGGDSIQVTAVSSTSATIKVTRNNPSSYTTSDDDWVRLARTTGYDSTLRVGDTMTLFVGDFWNQESFQFVWLRNGVVIPGATTQNYSLVAADAGTKISGYIVPAGQPSLYPYNMPAGGYTVAKGVYQASEPGSVIVTQNSSPSGLHAATTGWPSGTTFTFKWLKGATATTATTAATGAVVNAAMTSDYTFNSADWNQFLRVQVTATVPGYNPVIRYPATARNYSLYTQTPVPATFKINGTPKLGTQVTANMTDLAYFDNTGNSITGVSYAYQWLRNGVAITDTPAATIDATDGIDYTLRPLDYNASVTMRLTISKPGYVSRVIATPVFKPTIKGTITASSPTVTINNALDATAPMKVLLTLSTSGVTETDTTSSTQWYRVNRTTGVATAITGATLTAYKPVAADYAYNLRAITTIKKLNYDNLPIISATRDFSLRIDATTPLTVSGAAVVDGSVSTSLPLIKREDSPGNVNTYNWNSPGFSKTVQWRRAGVNIAGANGTSYIPVAADVAKALSYTVIISSPGYMPYTGTSPNTAATALATFTHNQDVAIQHLEPANPLKMHALAGGNDVAPYFPATTVSYQWTRNGVAIPGATTADYTLTAADFGKTVKARVSYKLPGYNTYSQNDVNGSGNYWIRANSTLPEIIGDRKVGGTIHVDPRTYFDMVVPTDGMTIPSGDVLEEYQWYRTTIVNKKSVTVAIPAPDGTASSYTIKPTDKGAQLSVKMSVKGKPGQYTYDLPNITTSLLTPAIGTEVLPGTNNSPPQLTVVGNAIGITSTGITSPNAVPNTVAYQWLRDGVAIAKATKATYLLTASDKNHAISVRVVTSHAAIGTTVYTTDVRYSNSFDYTIKVDAGSLPYLSGGAWEVGTQVGVYFETHFTNAYGTAITPDSVKVEFLRNVGSKVTVVQTGTDTNYTLGALDAGAKMTARVTFIKAGYLSGVYTTPLSTVVLKGNDNDAWYPVIQAGPAVGVMTAAISDLMPVSPAPTTVTYKWYRNGSFITGATAKTYRPVAADLGKSITVQVTITRAGFNALAHPTKVSAAVDPTIYMDPLGPTLSSSSAQVGVALTATPPPFYANSAKTTQLDLPDLVNVYTWYRSNVAIAGATQATYTPTSLDIGKVITVKVTANYPGKLAKASLLSGATTAVTAGTIDKGTLTPTPTINLTTRKATVSYTGAAVTTGLTTSYQWFRNNVAISGATASSYTLLATDTNKSINVRITLSKTGYSSSYLTTGGATGQLVNGFYQAEPIYVTGTPTVGNQLSCAGPNYYKADGWQAAGTVVNTGTAGDTMTYKWYRDLFDEIPGATGYNYTVDAADSGHGLNCRITVGAPLHKTFIDPSAAPVFVP